MIMIKDYIAFSVLGKDINLYTHETDYGTSTVAEIDEMFYHLGKEYPNVATAIFAWQDIYNRELTDDELRQVLKENNLD